MQASLQSKKTEADISDRLCTVVGRGETPVQSHQGWACERQLSEKDTVVLIPTDLQMLSGVAGQRLCNGEKSLRC